ncbi:MAG: endonuclease/exonuclease/phosphatase family protein [Actinophytocola sp.]|uniref:endonuclease/exonuclease/phosphatase family protein n=1 Tax=Actinophytocola sp. TaxID=1872138 RepID=UPI001322AB41|nr:endonuclease/exonuclease/phosphatase family protein [Actinophytocola sp.]MPZ83461.1 endonuclease/exonuclease/phosphatase family protein [Actinophytocola sp.]
MGRSSTRAFDPPVEPDYDDDGPRRRPGGRKLGFLLVLLALAFVAFVVLRIAGIEPNAELVAAMALTPYVTAAGLVLGLLCMLLRRRVVGVAVLLLSVALTALLAPRLLSEEQPGANGERLRVMSVNLSLGKANASTVLSIARSQKADVLVMPELTQAAVDALDEAGLYELFPERVFEVGLGGEGTGVASRLPLRKIVLMDETTMRQPSMVVDMPGRDDIELTAVHVQPGVHANSATTWRRELSELPRPTPDVRVRILAGDFNATFDHAAFRAMVDRGYADAGEEIGDGLSATWQDWPLGPPVAIDHILVDNRCAIASYAVFDIPGSDHNAIVSEVVLP